MHNLLVEHRLLSGSLSQELARQIYLCGLHGKIAVVTDRPLGLMAATKKKWVKLTRQVQRERSSTINATKIAELTERIAWMRTLKFSAKPPDDLLEADVTFATAENFVRIPPVCPTVCVAYKFDKAKLYMLTSWMPKGGKVIIYEN